MEVAALAGLLGLGFVVSKTGQKKSNMNQPAPVSRVPASHTIPPADHTSPLFRRSTNEAFVPSARGPNSEPMTNAPKGASATGFGPELDLMYKMPNGQT